MLIASMAFSYSDNPAFYRRAMLTISLRDSTAKFIILKQIVVSASASSSRPIARHASAYHEIKLLPVLIWDAV